MKSILGDDKQVACISCGLQSGEIKLFGEKIVETEHFDVSQDYEIPIPGFFILASKEHKAGLADFSQKESYELMDLLRRTRIAMKEALGIEYIHLIQEEDSVTRDSHFHIWLMPRYEWMKSFGARVSSARDVIKHAKANMKTDEHLEEVRSAITKTKDYFEREF